MQTRFIQLGLLSSIIAFAGCASTHTSGNDETKAPQLGESKQIAIQHRTDVLGTLKTYREGETTLRQFLVDAGYEVTGDSISLVRSQSEAWKVFCSVYSGSPDSYAGLNVNLPEDILREEVLAFISRNASGGSCAAYVVGYSGGPLAFLGFKDKVLTEIDFRWGWSAE